MNRILKVLIIGFVWPEPNSSAAGSRMIQLINFFKEHNYSVYFASTASETTHMVDLSELNVISKRIQLNNDSFDEYLKELSPEIVVFDRFMIEEQFGWRVTESCPNALRILDTEDLHSLRKTRHEALKHKKTFCNEMLLSSEIAKREIASIYRSDLTLIISTYEFELLRDFFGIDESLLCYLPFIMNRISSIEINNTPYADRKNFMCIGNFRHAPNWDMVLYLKQTIWPLISKKLPKVEMHVYGSYPSEKVTQLHNEKERFFIKGWVDDVHKVMGRAKVNLAPIRFGAGIKGKLTDAMKNGLPSVTTSIGAEGMHDGLPWSGLVEDDPVGFSNAVIELYIDKEKWYTSQKNGCQIINEIYANKKYQDNFFNKLQTILKSLPKHRQLNFIGSILNYHLHKSTKYLSKWISEKEKKNQ